MARLNNESPPVVFYAISVACVLIAQLVAYVAANFDFPSRIGWLALCSFVFQWLVFLPSAFLQTAAYFDVAGSSAYFFITLYSLVAQGSYYTRQTVLTLCILVWAARLGLFLYTRIQKAGGDQRFDEIKQHGPRFFNMWSIQALWVFLVCVPVYVLNSSDHNPAFGFQDVIGFSLWLCGFLIEVLADAQKTAHNQDPATKNTFIATGLWQYSRHPNYFGEIMLWVGVLIVCSTVFHGFEWVAVCSPLFVTYLLLKVSGIPLLEDKADAKWGLDADYIAYKERTPKLMLWPFVEGTAAEKSELAEPIIAGDDIEEAKA